MNKFFIIIFFISSLYADQIIQFVFSDNKGPVYLNPKYAKVEYKITPYTDSPLPDEISNKINKWKIAKCKKSIRWATKDGHNLYTIEGPFDEILFSNCWVNEFEIEFKIRTWENEDSTYNTGSQMFSSGGVGDEGAVWTCNQTNGVYSSMNSSAFLDSPNEVIKKGGQGKNGIIKIISGPPELKLSGLLHTTHNQKNKNYNIDVRRSKNSLGKIEVENISDIPSEYAINIKLRNNIQALSDDTYGIFILIENYSIIFKEVAYKNLIRGDNLDEDIKLYRRYPFDNKRTSNPSPKKQLDYNNDCMRWMCKDKNKIWIRNNDTCVPKCKEFEVLSENHECELDVEHLKYPEILECMDSTEFPPIVPNNNSSQEALIKYCLEKHIKSQTLTDDFFADYWGECNFGDYIDNMLCDDTNKDITNDYFSMIKLSDALYKNIRFKYSDNKLKNLLRKYQDDRSFNDIERLILMYNRIDELHKQKADKITEWGEVYLEGPIPTPEALSIIADHYLRRIEFYVWYFESLFYLDKTEGNSLKAKHRILKKGQKFDFNYLCKNKPIPKDFGEYNNTWNVSEFLKKINRIIKKEFKRYDKYGRQASDYSTYPWNENLRHDITTKSDKIHSELN